MIIYLFRKIAGNSDPIKPIFGYWIMVQDISTVNPWVKEFSVCWWTCIIWKYRKKNIRMASTEWTNMFFLVIEFTIYTRVR